MQIISIRKDWKEIKNYCEELKAKAAKPETAKCAYGREQFWLQAEPNYYTRRYKKALQDPTLWDICKEIYPEGDLAQIYFGNRGINWHRDATYCTPIARILNLGKALLESQGGIQLSLTGGEIIEFNSKALHRGTPLSPDRIGIGIWNAKIPLADPYWE